MSEANTPPPPDVGASIVKRHLDIPDPLYQDILEENLKQRRAGARRNTEKEMLELMRDGLLVREMQRAGTVQEVSKLLRERGIKIVPY